MPKKSHTACDRRCHILSFSARWSEKKRGVSSPGAPVVPVVLFYVNYITASGEKMGSKRTLFHQKTAIYSKRLSPSFDKDDLYKVLSTRKNTIKKSIIGQGLVATTQYLS